ncbi:hypothetical protein [Couchioplanes caeruleus]|uniref:Uncharacterized protein n=2 Tax=Couchioplanes caeruleus TaxID=56438 RepID=A0A1K0GNH4_9ACTN|nr:hypothetical protein [Couchioplanes caeruleus]OJF13910.1 hypothetical protein BG844_12465 [Couchioplanes caeruleus subsp. caeruleus]ROP34392.1 hypothetical protein EDD30_7478 [Couchioplanes caeruleus]
MLTAPDPRPEGPVLRPAVPTTTPHPAAPSDENRSSGAPDHAREAATMADQRAAEPARATDDDRSRPATPRLRPGVPEKAGHPADLQTTSGVPKRPISTVEASQKKDTEGQKGADPAPEVKVEGDKSPPEVEGESDPDETVLITLPTTPEKTTPPPSGDGDQDEPETPDNADEADEADQPEDADEADKPEDDADDADEADEADKPEDASVADADDADEADEADKPEDASVADADEADEADKPEDDADDAEADDAGDADKPEDPDETMVLRTRPGEPASAAKDTPTASADDTIVLPPSKPAAPPETDKAAEPEKAGDKEAPRNTADDTVVVLSRPADETVAIPAAVLAPPADPTVTAIIPVVPGRKGGMRSWLPGGPSPARAPKPARPRREPLDLGHAPAVLMISALGVLMVALAYAGGRIGTGNAQFAYWVGQVVVFTPVVVRLLSRRMAGVAESFLLVMGLALHQYLLKWMYSPDQFRFPDELQHWLATTIIVESGDLFRPNPALPPAVHFPGLAEMGAAVTSMTGLSVTAAGVVVAGVAHLVFVAVLFAAVLRASNSPAVAGVCCVTYATALHYLFFNSMFLYQTAALPFFMLTIWAIRRWRTGGGPAFVALAVGSIALTTVSHHITAFALVLTLLLLAASELIVQRPRRWSALIMPAAAVVVVAAWMLTVAQDVLGYLEAPIEQVGQTISNLLSGREEASSTTAAVSIGQLVVQGTGLLGLFVLYVALVRDMIHRHDRDHWRWAAVVGGAIFFAGNGVRFLGQNGPEIAGRLSTFTYVPISILAAIALVRGVQLIPAKDAEGHRWRAAAPAIDVVAPSSWNLYSRVAAGSAMITLLMIGARAGGWPPLQSILPGPYLAGGFERSVDAYGMDAAEWQRRALGPGNRVGGDVTSVSLASTYGRQDPVREVGPLYYADEWGLAQEQFADGLGLQYLVVDRRLSEQLPEGEAYFENDPNAGSITRPLTATQIFKFDALLEVDRLYDNGTVRVYRMGVQ